MKMSVVPRAARHRALALTVATLLGAAPGPATAETGAEVMQKQRSLQRVKDEEERQRLTLVSKTGATKERTFVRFTLTGGDDLDKILVRFLAPRDVENTALLTWEAKDGNDDQWLYLPATKKPKRIAASGKKNRFMGTDFAYEDLRPETLTAHRYTLAGADTIDGQACFVVDAAPATDRQAADSGYSKRRIWIRQDTYATVKREYYDRQGKLEKVETLRKLVNVKGSVWRANEIEMHDVQNGTRTLVTVERRAVDRGLKDDFFTLSELTRGGS
jgi:outer membrane lipoprotein-sorting protein